jgi:hypothetical protein
MTTPFQRGWLLLSSVGIDFLLDDIFKEPEQSWGNFDTTPTIPVSANSIRRDSENRRQLHGAQWLSKFAQVHGSTLANDNI